MRAAQAHPAVLAAEAIAAHVGIDFDAAI